MWEVEKSTFFHPRIRLLKLITDESKGVFVTTMGFVVSGAHTMQCLLLISLLFEADGVAHIKEAHMFCRYFNCEVLNE